MKNNMNEKDQLEILGEIVDDNFLNSSSQKLEDYYLLDIF